MTSAKITSFLGGLIYLIVFAIALFYAGVINKLFSENFGITDTNLFALILAATFLFAIGNFCFSYFIQRQETFHEKMDSAFFFSLQLLIIPLILFVGLVILFVSLG